MTSKNDSIFLCQQFLSYKERLKYQTNLKKLFFSKITLLHSSIMSDRFETRSVIYHYICSFSHEFENALCQYIYIYILWLSCYNLTESREMRICFHVDNFPLVYARHQNSQKSFEFLIVINFDYFELKGHLSMKIALIFMFFSTFFISNLFIYMFISVCCSLQIVVAHLLNY